MKNYSKGAVILDIFNIHDTKNDEEKKLIEGKKIYFAYTHNILEQQFPNQQQHNQQCRRKKEKKRVEII